MEYAAHEQQATAQPTPVGEMPPYLQAENASEFSQASAQEAWEPLEPQPQAAQPTALDPVDVLASNQHPLTQPATPQMASSEMVDSLYAEPAAQPAAAEVMPQMASEGSLGDKISALVSDIQALEAENAALKAQLHEVDSLRAKEVLLRDSAEKLQAILDAMRG